MNIKLNKFDWIKCFLFRMDRFDWFKTDSHKDKTVFKPRILNFNEDKRKSRE